MGYPATVLEANKPMNQDATACDWARQLIQAAGLRATPARIATLLVLRDSPIPLSHAEVADCLQDREIVKTTVYRNLNAMTTANLVRRLELGDHVWRFEFIAEAEPEHESQSRFVCVDCGAVALLEETGITNWSPPANRSLGQITEILLRGVCHDCTGIPSRQHYRDNQHPGSREIPETHTIEPLGYDGRHSHERLRECEEADTPTVLHRR
ncbi:Fur family transcriptional regulator [Thalassoroseus pseudoceratinae]|uniref:Fur family transcriptional regulator n=1 Tax=Thalassoroseus pseudoceratinae TaxID=2713176 RepID=UPI001981D871|nr:transcriptional repressor [Thalassoroseus pseudoceratinae]